MKAFAVPAFSRILSIALIPLSLLISTPTWAGYTPGPVSSPSSPTTNTGRRGGCSGESAAELTVLAPKNHVGQTVSSHPTLAWFMPEDQDVPMEIFIYDITEVGQRDLVYKAEMTGTYGIMSMTLPESEPGLDVGHRYAWQVVLLCNPNRPSSALVTAAEFEVVPMPVDLATDLSQLGETETTDLDTIYQVRSRLYADAGLWYDAFADALQQSSNSSTVLELLDDLAQYEASHNASDPYLDLVIDALQAQL